MDRGTRYTSYDELENAVATFSNECGFRYFKRDSRTLAAAAKSDRTKRKALKAAQNLVYYFIDFACVQGGRKYLSKGTGARNVSTIRVDCPWCVKARISQCGQYLEVVSANGVHNHELGVVERVENNPIQSVIAESYEYDTEDD